MSCLVLLFLILTHQVITNSLDNDRRVIIYSQYDRINESTIQRTDYYEAEESLEEEVSYYEVISPFDESDNTK